MIKICTKCKIEKPFDEFGKDKKAKDGLKYQCKSCEREYRKQHYQANKKYYKESNKKYYQTNKEIIKESYKEYRQDNKERIKKYCKEYYQVNKEKIKERTKEYRQANKEYCKEYIKEWYQVNKERVKEYNKDNKERKKEYTKEWYRERRKTDPLFKMNRNLRKRTWEAFKNKGYKKTSKTQEMLGVDWEIAKQHIERQFTKGMNWDNQGEWHIDHIIPLASANNKEELMKLCHYTNLQPLWAKDNLSKSDKIIEQQIKFRI